MPKAPRGFTLLELMIVVAIIGILASIAIPRFAETLRHANEGATRGNLGAIRSALGIYFADMEGVYPVDAAALTVDAKYMARIPPAKRPPHHPEDAAFELTADMTVDNGKAWGYNDVPGDANWGKLWVLCTHTDSTGRVWTTY